MLWITYSCPNWRAFLCLTVRWKWSPLNIFFFFCWTSMFCRGEVCRQAHVWETHRVVPPHPRMRTRTLPCCLCHSILSPPLGPCSLENPSLSSSVSSSWHFFLSLEVCSLLAHLETLPSFCIPSICCPVPHLSSSRKRSLHSVHFLASHTLFSFLSYWSLSPLVCRYLSFLLVTNNFLIAQCLCPHGPKGPPHFCREMLTCTSCLSHWNNLYSGVRI